MKKFSELEKGERFRFTHTDYVFQKLGTVWSAVPEERNSFFFSPNDFSVGRSKDVQVLTPVMKLVECWE